MHKIIIITALTLILAACGSTRDVELPNNEGDGTDLMRKSPCACAKLDFDGRGFKWVG
ncbi:MAG: hypothetical protein HQL35_09075 [Alphaproteobacteria bacterium]|nr:hypothetical protein [Alphaproteobacteria bacterium]